MVSCCDVVDGFIWSDGSPLDQFEKWNLGGPNGDDNTDCVGMYTTGHDRLHWYSARCEGRNPFMCKAEQGRISPIINNMNEPIKFPLKQNLSIKFNICHEATLFKWTGSLMIFKKNLGVNESLFEYNLSESSGSFFFGLYAFMSICCLYNKSICSRHE